MHRPALNLSPFDVTGKTVIVEEWTGAYSSHGRDGTKSQLFYLLYLYEEGWSNSNNFKAFGMVRKEKMFAHDEGIARGWDRPSFSNKVNDPF